MEFNEPVFQKTIKIVKTGNIVQKKVAIYSHKAMVLLRYLQLSNPKFSRSRAAREKLFQIIPEHHPELWERILSEIPLKKESIPQWEGKTSQLKRPQIKLLNEAFAETKTTESRIITVYSPQLAALFKYLDHTTIRFNTSAHGAEMLEEILSREYPEIWEIITTLTS